MYLKGYIEGDAVGVWSTEIFRRWLLELRDVRGRARIIARIERLADGNPGDASTVGDGVSELRIHVGPGYRVYFTRIGKSVVVLLAGGDKSSQVDDIRIARQLARDL
jgi:putative addiction module killer protein